MRTFVEAIHRRPQTEEYRDAISQAAPSTLTNAATIMIANLILMGPTDLRTKRESADRPVLFIYSTLEWAVAADEEVRVGWP